MLETNQTPSEYLRSLRSYFEQHAHPENAPAMEKYMRNQFKFLGIKKPEQTALFKQFIAKQGWPALSQLDDFLLTLWSWPEREFQYLGSNFLHHFRKHLPSNALPTLEQLITTKSWWDTVDSLASHTVGDLFKRRPNEVGEYIHRWRHSDNIWLRRTTLLFQLSYKANTNEALLFALVEENASSDEFFIQKAIGWALREYSKTAPNEVNRFVETHAMAALSKREALKRLKAKGLV
ncbi:MAG: DNA alkylation repair protein [Leptolyngbyaceae cyanobacterium MO_188.B28]|nr:DNA alkylation repair protein [Leptolyngbyaceae cyanobacterium MO_188.B28]